MWCFLYNHAEEPRAHYWTRGGSSAKARELDWRCRDIYIEKKQNAQGITFVCTCIFLSRLKLPVLSSPAIKKPLWFIYLVVITAARREWPITFFCFQEVGGGGGTWITPRFQFCLPSLAYLLYSPPQRISKYKYTMKYRVWCPAQKKQIGHYCHDYSEDLARGKRLIYSRTRLSLGFGVIIERNVYICTRYYCAFGLRAFCN